MGIYNIAGIIFSIAELVLMVVNIAVEPKKIGDIKRGSGTIKMLIADCLLSIFLSAAGIWIYAMDKVSLRFFIVFQIIFLAYAVISMIFYIVAILKKEKA